MSTSPSPTLTILASDKPAVGRCCRCRGPVDGGRVIVLLWDLIEFWYCGKCREKMGL